MGVELDASLPVGKITGSPASKQNMFRTVHIVCYIFAAVGCRHYTGWQWGLKAGFGSFIIAQTLTVLGCVCHYLCLMEIWSAVPFSGGSYALSRATLGFYAGFLDGTLEALVYIGQSALSAYPMGGRICAIFKQHPDNAPYYAWCFYALAVILTIQPSALIQRRAYVFLGLGSVGVLAFYCLYSLKWSNFMENASMHVSETPSNLDNWFHGGIFPFMWMLPLVLQPYSGIRAFTLLTSRTENPKSTLPKAVAIGFSVIIALNVLDIFVFVSQPGGIHSLMRTTTPLAVTWSKIFGVSGYSIVVVDNIMQLTCTFARIYAYIYPAGVMLQSMAKSNLLPSVLRIGGGNGVFDDHSSGCIVAAILGGVMVIILHYFLPTWKFLNVTVMASLITDCSFLYGYYLLKTTYSTVPREFVSPLGIPGAIFAFVMYLLIFIASAFFQHDWFPLEFFAVFLAAMSAYYFLFARASQTLNEEEDQVFFKMHVKNFNMRKKSPGKRFDWKKSGARKHNKVYAAGASPAIDGSSGGSGSGEGGSVDTSKVTAEQQLLYGSFVSPEPESPSRAPHSGVETTLVTSVSGATVAAPTSSPTKFPDGRLHLPPIRKRGSADEEKTIRVSVRQRVAAVVSAVGGGSVRLREIAADEMEMRAETAALVGRVAEEEGKMSRD